MAAGASIEDPATTHIGLDAVVEADAVIRPYTFLEGRTVVRRGASVGPFARLVDAEIGPDAQVLDHCLLRECVVGAGGHGRALRPHPPGEPHRRQGQGGQLRGAQEDAPRRRVQGAAPVVHRRRHRRAGREHRRRDHHLQLRRHPQAPHPHRGRGLHRQQQHAGGPGHGGRRGVRRGGQRRHRGRPRGRPGAGARPAGREAGMGRGARPQSPERTDRMCGIVGYVGAREAVPVIIEGLRRLEYRGYDSAGVAVVQNCEMLRRRSVGKLKNLEESLRAEPMAGAFGIGHTRWATHGRPSEENAHPHQDCHGKIVVVHNGIIENYLAAEDAAGRRGAPLRHPDRHRGRGPPRRVALQGRPAGGGAARR